MVPERGIHSMIEIIREEEWERESERNEAKKLPRDIRQIGRPDAGDRIYIENQVYRFLHSNENAAEKTAYVLLGRFENIAEKQCIFVESAIHLEEMRFEGSLPIWTDHTWSYIYKRMKKEREDMAIVGCALDIRGQLPGMTVKLEAIHQKNFGGRRQILLLMDTLEQEEAFYGNSSGHLQKRTGFYIYFAKNHSENGNMSMEQMPEETDAPEKKEAVSAGKKSAARKKKSGRREKSSQNEDRRNSGVVRAEQTEPSGNFEETDFPEQSMSESDFRENEFGGNIDTENDAGENREPNFSETGFYEEHRMHQDPIGEKNNKENFSSKAYLDEESGYSGKELSQSGKYRERLKEKSRKHHVSSYIPSAALFAIVCLMGFTAFQNHRKMNEMEVALTHIDGEETAATENADHTDKIKVESVAGNVQKQDAETIDVQAVIDQPGNAGNMAGNASDVQTDAAVTANTENGPADAVNTESGTAVASNAENGAADESGTSPNTEESAANTDDPQSGTETTGEKAADGTDTSGKTAGTEEQQAAEAPTDTETADAMSEAKAYLAQGYYIVQKGDNLVSICRKIYQTTAMMDKICEVNDIENQDAIYAGQYLILPN